MKRTAPSEFFTHALIVWPIAGVPKPSAETMSKNTDTDKILSEVITTSRE
jgi:hypothetical protein